ncbi:MAG: hypothetical protein IJ880_07290 [Bacilli bacterium]|nr:hypothetical protein [Bacilli bacterium]MBR3119748.1 hypothetical protein [Oceanobacillus sp.]
MFMFLFTVAIASAATIAPVYKIKKILVWILKIPILGWAINISYGLFASTILLKLFAFQSSTAGLANLTSTFVFAAWIQFESKKRAPKLKTA